MAVQLVLHRTFDDVDDLFAWVAVPGSRRAGREVDADLDSFMFGSAEVMTPVPAPLMQSVAGDSVGHELSF